VAQQSKTVVVDKLAAAGTDSVVSPTQTAEDRDLMAESNQDRDAILLEFNEPRIAVMGSREIKELERTYFEAVELEDTLLFGGTLGASPGGVTAFALSANGKLVAQAINNGSILVYDTENFQLIRLFEGDTLT
jgi:hypothetical protein